MAAFIDFKVVKETVSAEKAVALLGLAMKKHGDQLRSACPQCKTGGDRALTVNLNKNAYFCFSDGKGGDVIALAAHVKGIAPRDAALFLAGGTVSTVPQSTAPTRSPAPAGPKRAFDARAYAKGLDPEHEALQSLGIGSETFKAFACGYSASGINRGRLALPLTDSQGNVLGYVGRALTEEQQPKLVIPNGVEVEGVIFGKIEQGIGELYLMRDVLDVLRAHEDGLQAVCVLTDGLSALQLQVLAALMDEMKIERLEF